MASQNFETDLNRLEALVQQLEKGELSLEESLATFEEGNTLARRCQQRLDEAERRIEELTAISTNNPSPSPT